MSERKPRDAWVAWAVGVVAPDAVRIEATGLRDGGAPWLLRMRGPAGDAAAVLRVGAPGGRDTIDLEARALQLAGSAALPAPPVYGITVAEGDIPLLLIGLVGGASTIPPERPRGRLRTLGALAARIHAIDPPPGLPRRTRPIAGEDFAALRRGAEPVPLLERAEAAVAGGHPDAVDGFVHGDLWQGNTLWKSGALSGVIDWDCAGVGAAGVDLGSVRCDAALCFGVEAADDVLDGWEVEAAHPAVDVAYWDAVAALSTPPDLGWFVQAIGSQGRPDLTRETLTARRDAFLEAALGRLDA